MDKSCFVIMPFSDKENPADNKWDDLFDNHIKPAVEDAKLGYTCVRSLNPHGNFMKHIMQHISTAEVVIAVLTELRPNVMYELGVRNALRRKTIMLAEIDTPIPSDLSSYIALWYSTRTTNGRAELKKTIADRLQLLETADLDSDSPVSDYLWQKAQEISDDWLENKKPESLIQRLQAILPSYAFRLEPILSKVKGHIAELEMRAAENAKALESKTPESVSIEERKVAGEVAREAASLPKMGIRLTPGILRNIASDAFYRKDYHAALVLWDQLLKDKPRSAILLLNKSITLNNLDRYTEALRNARKALEIDPTLAEAWYTQAVALANLNRNEEALQSVKKALEIDPKLAEAWHIQALALNNLDRNEEALQSTKNALEIDPNRARAWDMEALTLGSLGRYEEALQSAKKALEIDPKLAEAWNTQAMALNNLDRNEEALQSAKNALEIDPNRARAWNTQSVALANLGRNEEALQSAKNALEIDPKLADAWYAQAAALGNLGRHKEALQSTKKALEIDPKLAEAWHVQAAALGFLDRYEEALQSTKKALEIDPKLAGAWHAQAVALGNLGRHKEALQSAKKALETDPKLAGAWHIQALALANLDRYEEALQSARKALEIDPDNRDACRIAGRAAFFARRCSESEAFFRKAIQLSNDNPTSDDCNSLGFVLEVMGRNEEALEFYERCLSIDPKYSYALYNKGSVLRKLGGAKEGDRSIEQALALDSNVREVIEGQKKSVGKCEDGE